MGLVIRTDDGRALERALHTALDRAAARMNGAVGDEWFETTPQKIKEWYSGYVQTIGVLRRENLLTAPPSWSAKSGLPPTLSGLWVHPLDRSAIKGRADKGRQKADGLWSNSAIAEFKLRSAVT